MAIVLKLVRASTTLTLNATYSATGFMVHSWVPKIATPEVGCIPEPVVETMSIRTRETTQDGLATDLQALADMQLWARSYTEDSSEFTPVWLHAKLTNETQERRVLVRRIDAVFSTPWYGPLADNAKYLGIELVIEREPYWEAVTTYIPTDSASPAAAAAVVVDYTVGTNAADIAGDVGARIGELTIAGGVASPLGRLWVGLRSATKHSTLANFVPIWELENGSRFTDAALAADATASPGGVGNTKTTVTPGTATWAKRLSIILGNVTANYADNLGRFLWLLRCKVSAGTWEIQLRHGYTGTPDTSMVLGPIVQLTNTSWDFLSMGVGNIPYTDPWSVAGGIRGDEQHTRIAIYARRTSGAGTLDLDCLCPLPIDEGYFIASAFNAGGGAANAATRYHGPRYIQVLDGISGWEAIDFTEDRFVLPPGDGRMVIAYARNTSSVLTDTVVVSAPKYVPRWLSLRGTE